MAEASITAHGISPLFIITSENFILDYLTSLTPVNIDGVRPPWLGNDGGYSHAMSLHNRWYPWIDEPINVPKYDGVCRYMGQPSNRPTPIKDYHMLTLFRATDYMLAPHYSGLIEATVDGPLPIPPPPENEQ